LHGRRDWRKQKPPPFPPFPPFSAWKNNLQLVLDLNHVSDLVQEPAVDAGQAVDAVYRPAFLQGAVYDEDAAVGRVLQRGFDVF
jgi:hypothetical protein